MVSGRLTITVGGHLGEAAAITVQDRGRAREGLPAAHRNVDVGRAELDRVAGPAGHLGRYDRGSGAAERLVDRLPGRGVVLDRALHAGDRLLRPVAEPLVLASVDVPDRRLLAAALPIGGAPHRVPARLMLPMVMAAREREALLCPDDLAADLEARRRERLLHGAGMAAGMPDIGDRAREERPRLAPVGAVVVCDL